MTIFPSARRLVAVSAACVLLGWSAIAVAWGHPHFPPALLLATACGWPWLLAAIDGALIWCDGGQRLDADPLRHFLAAYAAGTVVALLAAAAVIALAEVGVAGLDPLPCGPLSPLCEAAAFMAFAAFFAGATAGLVFPAFLPCAAAAISAALLRGRRPSDRRLAMATAATALGWLAAAVAGFALAHA